MIEILSNLPPHTVGFKLSGKLHDEDYKKFVPLVDAEIAKEGKVNILSQFHDFHGWDAKALWDDIKFSTTIAPRSEKSLSSAKRRGKNGWPKSASRSRWPESNTSMPPKSMPQRRG